MLALAPPGPGLLHQPPNAQHLPPPVVGRRFADGFPLRPEPPALVR
ncbi:hypothetical protein [Kitasatospora sp. NPDC059571]